MSVSGSRVPMHAARGRQTSATYLVDWQGSPPTHRLGIGIPQPHRTLRMERHQMRAVEQVGRLTGPAPTTGSSRNADPDAPAHAESIMRRV